MPPGDKLVLAPARSTGRQLVWRGEFTFLNQPIDHRLPQARATFHLVELQTAFWPRLGVHVAPEWVRARAALQTLARCCFSARSETSVDRSWSETPEPLPASRPS